MKAKEKRQNHKEKETTKEEPQENTHNVPHPSPEETPLPPTMWLGRKQSCSHVPCSLDSGALLAQLSALRWHPRPDPLQPAAVPKSR
jgi:hypothetical protein